MKNNLKWKRAIININSTIHEAIKKLELAEVQILMVVANNSKFVGTMTDGDVRRVILNKIKITAKIKNMFSTPLPPKIWLCILYH